MPWRLRRNSLFPKIVAARLQKSDRQPLPRRLVSTGWRCANGPPKVRECRTLLKRMAAGGAHPAPAQADALSLPLTALRPIVLKPETTPADRAL